MMRKGLAELMRVAAWAPVSVIILHFFVTLTPWPISLDWLMHFLGGASAAFFLFHAVRLLPGLFGVVCPLTHFSLAFGLTCAVAIAWEIVEFAGDQWFDLGVQHSLAETMLDFIFGVCGALLALGSIGGIKSLRRKA